MSCVKASEVLEVSHDEINRFLLSSRFTGKDLFEAVKQGLCLEGGVLSVDDSVLDKPFTDPATTELVDYFWSGRHHKVVKGISLITLFYTDPPGVGLPVNFRVYRHLWRARRSTRTFSRWSKSASAGACARHG